MKNRIARVFSRQTNATPADALAFVNRSPPRDQIDIDEVHVSVTFTYDKATAETLAEAWHVLGVPVLLGSPAYGEPGGDFVPGLYLKEGYIISSRGCPNACWFCSVPKREGLLRELPIANGWNLLDDNILACSEEHIRDVFDMLGQQPHLPVLSGGPEAKRLRPWHVDLIRRANVRACTSRMIRPTIWNRLSKPGNSCVNGGISAASHRACCYVLIGYPSDTMTKAEARLIETIQAGFMPYAMLFRGFDGQTDPEWRRFQREWVRPQYVGAKMREYANRQSYGK